MSDGELDYNLIIFLVILGAAAAALCFYAVARIRGNFEQPNAFQISDEQLAYMREVRERNVSYLRWLTRNSRPEHSSTQYTVVS
jgi:membrane protein DedA with SNARE-associated domain